MGAGGEEILDHGARCGAAIMYAFHAEEGVRAMSDRLLELYLRSLREDHASGEAAVEVSGYGALQMLLNSAGECLSPRVRAVINPRNRGAGTPDGGLFTSDQFRHDDHEWEDWPAQLPARGAVEVKGLREDVEEIAATEQVGRYLDRYGQVLVTNYRDFLLVGRGENGELDHLERYPLATDERGFWWLAANRDLAEEHALPFGEFLTRALAHGSPIRRSRDLAWFLASYARESLARLDARSAEAETGALGTVRAALEEALGVGFEGPRGEHFFRSTLVQTLFYGMFSAWVLWSKQTPYGSAERFDWRLAVYTLNVPLIGALFEQLTLRSTMEALGLREVMDRTGDLLNRVEREPFFEDFEEEGAVQYFYEPFLEAFDPELRQQLGVWYTPREVVRYMVERVDRALKEELDVKGGLANESVYVLDPCSLALALEVGREAPFGLSVLEEARVVGDKGDRVSVRKILDRFPEHGVLVLLVVGSVGRRFIHDPCEGRPQLPEVVGHPLEEVLQLPSLSFAPASKRSASGGAYPSL
jgi:hypothetical protein